jgi:hypothetical protein
MFTCHVLPTFSYVDTCFDVLYPDLKIQVHDKQPDNVLRTSI